MGTVEQHITQWKHNRKCAQGVDCVYRDWQITIIFYTALHAVDAALKHLKIPVSNHEGRNEAVRTNASLASIRTKYLDLYRISKVTRYDADPDDWIPKEFLDVQSLAEAMLKPIEIEVERLIGKKLDLSTLKFQK
jgi:hypothetical protein